MSPAMSIFLDELAQANAAASLFIVPVAAPWRSSSLRRRILDRVLSHAVGLHLGVSVGQAVGRSVGRSIIVGRSVTVGHKSVG